MKIKKKKKNIFKINKHSPGMTQSQYQDGADSENLKHEVKKGNTFHLALLRKDFSPCIIIALHEVNLFMKFMQYRTGSYWYKWYKWDITGISCLSGSSCTNMSITTDGYIKNQVHKPREVNVTT